VLGYCQSSLPDWYRDTLRGWLFSATALRSPTYS
jgi:hypothetical protein